MAYPRLLNLADDVKRDLISYIESEILIHYAERNQHIQDYMRWQKEYWASPDENKPTNFVNAHASNIIIPITAISVESIYARVMTTRFALEDLVSCHAIAKDWADAAVPVERFMNHEMLRVMRVRKPIGESYLSAIKFGTMVGKVVYEKKVKTTIREINGSEEEIQVVTNDGAKYIPVPEPRFLMPYSDLDPQTSRWCGEEHSMVPYDVMLLEEGGMFYPGTIVDYNATEANGRPTTEGKYEAILKPFVNRAYNIQTGIGGNKVEREQETLEHRRAQWPKRIDWIEIQLAFDVDKSGKPKEIVVHYHRDARYLMAVRYNWTSNLRREYRSEVYFPVEYRWTGLGVCKQDEQFQKEITVQHRQKIDNGSIANMRMLKVHKLSGYGAKEPIFPGKMWFLNDMEHIKEFQLGEIYPSGYQNEQSALIYSQMRTGVNEVSLGQPQVGTPGTATSDLARIQESNKKWDLIYDNFNSFTQDIIMDTADVIQQFGPRQLSYLDTAENGDLVRQFFEMPASYIRDGIILNLKVTSQQANRLLDRNNWQQIGQGITQYIGGMIEMAQLLGDQQLMKLFAVKGMDAATEAFKQFLETFDMRNVDRMAFSDLVRQIQQQINGGNSVDNGNSGNVQPVGPTSIGLASNGQNGRLANFAGMFGPNRTNGAG
jgi:hypothetical protein